MSFKKIFRHRSSRYESIPQRRIPNRAATLESLERRVFLSITPVAATIASSDLVHTLARLSAPRTEIDATTIGSRAYFAGGGSDFHGHGFISDAVDIYDSATGMWSVSKAPAPIAGGAATSIGNKAVFTTLTLTNKVEVFNSRNQK